MVDSPPQALKKDSGKPDLSLISSELMVVLARVREFGSKKYSRNDWRNGFLYTRSISATLRHIFAFLEGEDLDPESGISHIGHAIAGLEHLLNDIKYHPGHDDRFKKAVEKAHKAILISQDSNSLSEYPRQKE